MPSFSKIAVWPSLPTPPFTYPGLLAPSFSVRLITLASTVSFLSPVLKSLTSKGTSPI